MLAARAASFRPILRQARLSNGQIALIATAITTLVGAALLHEHRVRFDGAGGLRAFTQELPPEPPPMLLREVPPSQALIINRRIPFSRDPNPPAHAFRVRGEAGGEARTLNCLTQAVYYEAASEPESGQQAVAQVILNRVRHPTFPKSVCAVVYQGSTLRTGCQFTFTCDGSLQRPPPRAEWRRAERIAKMALAGYVFAPVGYATHYHADFVVPYWSTSLAKNAVVGAHIFYRLPGKWGRPGAFKSTSARTEPNPILLRAAALAARRQHGLKLGRAIPVHDADLDIGANKGVELLSTVALLADRSPAVNPESDYAKEVREHFLPFADHTAVLIYRQLAAEDDKFASAALVQMLEANPGSGSGLKIPEFKLLGRFGNAGPGFGEALRNFAAATDFDAFFADHRPYYVLVAAPFRLTVVELLKSLQHYTGMSPPALRIVVAPSLSPLPPSDCTTSSGDLTLLLAPIRGSHAVEPHWARASEVRNFLQMMLVQDTLNRSACREGAEHCVTRPSAMHSRTEALVVRSFAARVGQADEAVKVTGPLATAYLSEAFTFYELNRRWFTTFADFYPVLLEVIAAAPDAAQGHGTARRTQGNSTRRQVDPRKELGETDLLVCKNV